MQLQTGVPSIAVVDVAAFGAGLQATGTLSTGAGDTDASQPIAVAGLPDHGPPPSTSGAPAAERWWFPVYPSGGTWLRTILRQQADSETPVWEFAVQALDTDELYGPRAAATCARALEADATPCTLTATDPRARLIWHKGESPTLQLDPRLLGAAFRAQRALEDSP